VGSSSRCTGLAGVIVCADFLRLVTLSVESGHKVRCYPGQMHGVTAECDNWNGTTGRSARFRVAESPGCDLEYLITEQVSSLRSAARVETTTTPLQSDQCHVGHNSVGECALHAS